MEFIDMRIWAWAIPVAVTLLAAQAVGQSLPTPALKGFTVSGGNAAARTSGGSTATVNADTATAAPNVYGPGTGSICAGCTSFDAVRAAMDVTAGTTVTGTNVFGGYLMNKNPQVGGGSAGNGVIFFGAGEGAVDNSGTWGINTALSDAPQTAGTTSGVGRKLIGYEADFTGTSTGTTITGISMLGSSTAQPSYAQAFVVGSLSVQNTALTKWNHSFVSTDGVSSEALFVGAMQTSGTSVASQPVTFNFFSSSGVEEYYQLQVLGTGAMAFTASNPAHAGLGINGPLFATGFVSQANGDSLITQVGHNAFYANSSDITGVTIGNSSGGTTTPITINGSVKLLVFLVSTLPTCNAAQTNAIVAVADATAPTYNGALTGGGAVHVPVFCNGTSWTAH